MPQLPRRKYSTQLSRVLRKHLTPAEALLWTVLRDDFAEKFRRQEPLGPYIADFVCYEHRVIVEVDGSQHDESESDKRRDAYLNGLGFRVLRVWNSDVLHHLGSVMDWIDEQVHADRSVARPISKFRRRPPE